MGDVTAKQVLDTPMQDNDAGAGTVRGYLVALLDAVWSEGEGFSGKRPFGNSGWEGELYEALARAGYIRGHYDAEDGYWDDFDRDAGRALIVRAIEALRVSDDRG